MSTSVRTSTDFNFRTDKKTNYKRPTVSLEYDVPTAEGVVALLQSSDSKVVSLLTETACSLLTGYIRGFVDADAEFDQAKLEALIADGKISIEAIANLPKSERSMLTKEDMEAFAVSYMEVMPEATGKSVEKVQVAANCFLERFKRVAGDEKVLAVLQDQLAVFCEAASGDMLNQHERVISYLASKVEELLSVSTKVTADAL